MSMRLGSLAVMRKCGYLFVVSGVLWVLVACTTIKGAVMSNFGITYQQARAQVYQVAHEIVDAIPADVADIVKVHFNYESDNSDMTIPFRAVIDIIINTHPQYYNENLTDVYRDILMKIPGFNTNVGDYHTHAPVLKKDDMIITLPTYHVERAFTIDGPDKIYDNLTHKSNPIWDNEFPDGALVGVDVTQDFLPAKTHQNPATISSVPTKPIIGRSKHGLK